MNKLTTEVAALETYLAWVCEQNEISSRITPFYCSHLRTMSALRTLLLSAPHPGVIKEKLLIVFTAFRGDEPNYIYDASDITGFVETRAELQAAYENLYGDFAVLPRSVGYGSIANGWSPRCSSCFKKDVWNLHTAFMPGRVYRCGDCNKMHVSGLRHE